MAKYVSNNKGSEHNIQLFTIKIQSILYYLVIAIGYFKIDDRHHRRAEHQKNRFISHNSM